MIAYLEGILQLKRPPKLVINAGGVGYAVTAPMSTVYTLPALQEPVSLWIHTVVKEDVLALYGFAHERDRELFEYLLRVSGIGPKVALTLLSGLSAADLMAALMEKNIAILSSLPGVGKKTAERLCIELGDKVPQWLKKSEVLSSCESSTTSQTQQDAIDALEALGYKPQAARRAVGQVAADISTEDVIKQALRTMVQGETA